MGAIFFSLMVLIVFAGIMADKLHSINVNLQKLVDTQSMEEN